MKLIILLLQLYFLVLNYQQLNGIITQEFMFKTSVLDLNKLKIFNYKLKVSLNTINATLNSGNVIRTSFL